MPRRLASPCPPFEVQKCNYFAGEKQTENPGGKNYFSNMELPGWESRACYLRWPQASAGIWKVLCGDWGFYTKHTHTKRTKGRRGLKKEPEIHLLILDLSYATEFYFPER